MGKFVIFGLVISCISSPNPAMATASEDVSRLLERLVQKLDTQSLPVHASDDGWLFLKRDVEAVHQAGTLLPAMVAQDSETHSQSAYAVIRHFHNMLEQAGIRLMLIPVPPKSAIYVDKLVPEATPEQAYAAFASFYRTLEQQGMDVLDLFSPFLAMRQQNQSPYCRLDTHWSPAAVERTAQMVTERLQGDLGQTGGLTGFQISPETAFLISGDLSAMLPQRSFAEESLHARQVRHAGVAFEPDENAEVLLMGDSHTLVYSQGLLARHAGLVDHLWQRLGVPLDLVGVLGGGVNGSRIKLARRRDNLTGKKVVIWCFTARDLVRPAQAWKAIPVIR